MSTVTGYASASAAQAAQAAQHTRRHRAEGKADFAAAAKALGVDDSKVADIQKQVDSAVSAARQGGTDKTQTRQAVQAAIEGVLKDNGIDPAKFKEQMDKQRAARAPQAQTSASGIQPQTAATFSRAQLTAVGARSNDADGDGDNDAGNGKVDVYG